MASSVKTIDEYISAYDGDLKERMITLRALIHSCHPDLTEKIAWGIPTFVLKGNLVHFSAEKKHMGFHPGQAAIDAFADRFGKLTHTKSTLHLPYDLPMPWELLREMTAFCVAETIEFINGFEYVEETVVEQDGNGKNIAVLIGDNN